MYCYNLSTRQALGLSPLEHSLDTVDFLHTRLKLLLVKGSLNRHSQRTLIVYVGGLVAFTAVMVNTSVQLGVNPFSNVPFFLTAGTLSPTWNLGGVTFRGIDFSTECIIYVLIVCWLACICGL